ncbi:hypothetical protein CTAYLR_003153 [Chrysophaeum taylorii]|uniref:Uncharacterized protein n=1 Tax=Chrysophaeum taylorii TaxID=2483200 RepID=A0AAD7UNP1_9STRA|nr:hypothetical protein CTAYLR_003153 [Chrysophaeum taylorii]
MGVCVVGVVAIEMRAGARREVRWHGVCARYGLSPDLGFLGRPRRLPPRFGAWEVLGARLASIEDLPSYLARMPVLDPSSLRGEDLRRAYVILGFAVQRVRPEIPVALAEPWIGVCGALDLPTGAVTAAATDLWNWDPELKVSMTGTRTETEFHRIPTLILKRAARELPGLLRVAEDVGAGRSGAVAATLRSLARFFLDAKRIFDGVWKKVDPHTFYDVYRPLLTTAPVVLHTRGAQKVVKSQGPSAGQSALFVILDAVLADETPGPHADFQKEMLAYMPLPHRALATGLRADLRAVGGVKQFAESRPRVAKWRGAARAAYADFRRFHYAVATRYLIRTDTGTGGSDFRPMLRDAIAKTSSSSSS